MNNNKNQTWNKKDIWKSMQKMMKDGEKEAAVVFIRESTTYENPPNAHPAQHRPPEVGVGKEVHVEKADEGTARNWRVHMCLQTEKRAKRKGKRMRVILVS